MADSDVQIPAAAAVPVEELEGKEPALEEPAPAAAAAATAANDDAVDASNPSETPPASGDHKRKLEDLEPHDEDEVPLKKQEISADADAPASGDGNVATGEVGAQVEPSHPGEGTNGSDDLKSSNMENTEAQEDGPVKQDSTTTTVDPNTSVDQPNLDGEVNGSGGQEVQKSESSSLGDDDLPPAQNTQEASVPLSETGQTSRKIEVPNSKVGVLIGKAGDTIKYLQYNSGAKIQITKDGDADPHSSTRPVELVGTPEQIIKAEKLIKDVMAEADAGGSPSLVARGFGTVQSGGDQIEIRVPNEKVGLIIGKGGDTIKNLQTRSGARIQLIPQHLPEGDASKERIVRITGNKKQIDSAKEMIKEVMNQMPIKPSPLSGGYSQQPYRPRGPAMLPQWGGRPTGPTQSNMGYDYPPRGTYPPPQGTQYPQPYGGYSQQPPPRGSFGAGWDKRQGGPVHSTPATGGYDYYGQGGHTTDTQPSNLMPNPNSAPNNAPMNYNYGQSQASGYGHQTPYAQGAPMQQNYGQGYSEPRYDSQAPNQQFYGQQPMGPQSYGQSSGAQSQYGPPQSYGKPGYGVPHEVPPSYGAPRTNQPGDTMYQGSGPTYGSGAPSQQSYPYGSNAPSQPSSAYNQTYGPASGAVDGYGQPSGAYSQHGGQAAPGYGQGGQPVPAYTQPSSQPAGYGQYPTSQQNYGDPASGNTSYGYHGGPTDGYGNAIPNTGYGAPQSASGQPAYGQPASNPSGYYDQSVPPQAGYGSHPGGAPVGYTKSVSPQPGYSGQYDSAQVYSHH